MKLGKKFLALALAGALALTTFTGCAVGSSGINGNALAHLLTMNLSLENEIVYDSSLNKMAETTMKAIKTKVDGETITLDNAVHYTRGTLIRDIDRVSSDPFTADGGYLKDMDVLELNTTNQNRSVRVSLVSTKYMNEKDDLFVLSGFVGVQMTQVQTSGLDNLEDHFRVGYYQSGGYLLVVLVGDELVSSSDTTAEP